MSERILIVEDDLAFGTMLLGWLRRNTYECEHRTTIASAQEALSNQEFDLILSDLRLPDGEGLELLGWMRQQAMRIPLIVMTSYGEVQRAVAAIKSGAEDFLEKPIQPTLLKDKIEQVLRKPAKETRTEPVVGGSGIVGNSPAAKKMYEYILKVAPTKMSVLILGESGTGKEYAARMIHENSSRRNEAFIAVDCGSLSKELAPSELFGHLKGSFTSAIADKTGVFEQANHGTVFLDEVGNLSYEVQVQLLRALQEQKIRPVGSNKDIQVDVRILAATNEDLEAAIAAGRFREDLYHRLNEFSLTLPPLRDRREDIALFANEFLRQSNQELSKQLEGFTESALKILEVQHWSGNLRELRNMIRRAALFASGKYINRDDLPEFRITPSTSDMGLRPGNEKEQIEEALRKARGNKTLAATLLKIDRKTLYNKMHALGIKF